LPVRPGQAERRSRSESRCLCLLGQRLDALTQGHEALFRRLAERHRHFVQVDVVGGEVPEACAGERVVPAQQFVDEVFLCRAPAAERGAAPATFWRLSTLTECCIPGRRLEH